MGHQEAVGGRGGLGVCREREQLGGHIPTTTAGTHRGQGEWSLSSARGGGGGEGCVEGEGRRRRRGGEVLKIPG